MALVAAIATVMLVSVLCAQWLAHKKRRPALGWMMAAAVLGPLPLMPLALLHKRVFHA